jgi:hypothetical protein
MVVKTCPVLSATPLGTLKTTEVSSCLVMPSCTKDESFSLLCHVDTNPSKLNSLELRSGYTLSPAQSLPLNLLWQPMGNITHQVTVLPYMRHFLIFRSKGQAYRTGSGSQQDTLPLNSPAQLPSRYNFAHQNSPKDRISSRGPRGSLGEVIKSQTPVLGVLLAGFDAKNLQSCG